MPGATLPPGIGNDQQAQQATAFIREQPWYAQLLQSWGMDPKGDANGNPQKLSEGQQAQLLTTAQQHGIGISDKYHIDENGQIAAVPSHVWRNIGIGAAVAGLALTGLGAAGIGPLAGAFGGAAGASGAIPAAFGSTAVDTVASAAPAAAAAAGGTGATLGSMYAAPAAAAGPLASGETGMAATTAAMGGLTPPASLGAVYGGAAPAVAAGSKAVSALTSPNIWSTIISGAGNLLGAWNASNASSNAAQLQSDAITHAADLQAKAAADSLAFQKQQWDTTQANQAPWLKTGQGAITTLGQLMGLNGSATSAPTGAPGPQLARPPVAGPGMLGSIYGTAGRPQTSAPVDQPASKYARITWPDGSQDNVPQASLDQYKLLGAQVNA